MHTCLQDAFKHAPGIIWMDSSFRLMTDKFQPVFKMAIANGGVVQFHRSPHSIFAGTAPRMWDYLVTDPTLLKNTRMYGASSMLLYKTETVYNRILHWWFMCALDQDCIAPLWSGTNCVRFKDMRTVRFSRCHRQDQSAISTLLANLYNFNITQYVPENRKELVVLCRSSKVRQYNATQCEK